MIHLIIKYPIIISILSLLSIFFNLYVSSQNFYFESPEIIFTEKKYLQLYKYNQSSNTNNDFFTKKFMFIIDKYIVFLNNLNSSIVLCNLYADVEEDCRSFPVFNQENLKLVEMNNFYMFLYQKYKTIVILYIDNSKKVYYSVYDILLDRGSIIYKKEISLSDIYLDNSINDIYSVYQSDSNTIFSMILSIDNNNEKFNIIHIDYNENKAYPILYNQSKDINLLKKLYFFCSSTKKAYIIEVNDLNNAIFFTNQQSKKEIVLNSTPISIQTYYIQEKDLLFIIYMSVTERSLIMNIYYIINDDIILYSTSNLMINLEQIDFINFIINKIYIYNESLLLIDITIEKNNNITTFINSYRLYSKEAYPISIHKYNNNRYMLHILFYELNSYNRLYQYILLIENSQSSNSFVLYKYISDNNIEYDESNPNPNPELVEDCLFLIRIPNQIQLYDNKIDKYYCSYTCNVFEVNVFNSCWSLCGNNEYINEGKCIVLPSSGNKDSICNDINTSDNYCNSDYQIRRQIVNCNEGEVLINNICIKCKSNNKLFLINTCVEVCQRGYFSDKDNGICRKILCPIGFFLDYITNTCLDENDVKFDLKKNKVIDESGEISDKAVIIDENNNPIIVNRSLLSTLNFEEITSIYDIQLRRFISVSKCIDDQKNLSLKNSKYIVCDCFDYQAIGLSTKNDIICINIEKENVERLISGWNAVININPSNLIEIEKKVSLRKCVNDMIIDNSTYICREKNETEKENKTNLTNMTNSTVECNLNKEYKFGNECVDKCPNNTFNVNRICIDCKFNTTNQECLNTTIYNDSVNNSNNTNNHTCKDLLVYNTKECVSECPLFYEELNKTCYKCVEPNLFYDLHNKSCSQRCSNNTIETNFICHNCSFFNIDSSKLMAYDPRLNKCSICSNEYIMNSRLDQCVHKEMVVTDDLKIKDKCSIGYKVDNNTRDCIICEDCDLKCGKYKEKSIKIRENLSFIELFTILYKKLPSCVDCYINKKVKFNETCNNTCDESISDYNIISNECFIKEDQNIYYCKGNGRLDNNYKSKYNHKCICDESYFGNDCSLSIENSTQLQNEKNKYMLDLLNSFSNQNISTISNISNITYIPIKSLSEILNNDNNIIDRLFYIKIIHEEIFFNSDIQLIFNSLITITDYILKYNLYTIENLKYIDYLFIMILEKDKFNTEINNDIVISCKSIILKVINNIFFSILNLINKFQGDEKYLEHDLNGMIYSSNTFSIRLLTFNSTCFNNTIFNKTLYINSTLYDIHYLNNSNIYLFLITSYPDISASNKSNIVSDNEYSLLLRNRLSSNINFTDSSLTTYSNHNQSLFIKTKPIKVYVPIKNDFDLSLWKTINSNFGYDIFNKDSPFYYDLCSRYFENNTDVTINYRRKYYNQILKCTSGCDYIGIENDNFICECNEDFQDLRVEFANTVLNPIKSSNFEVVKCYNLAFNKEILASNMGFYIIMIMIMLVIIGNIIYFQYYHEKYIEGNLEEIIYQDALFITKDNDDKNDLRDNNIRIINQLDDIKPSKGILNVLNKKESEIDIINLYIKENRNDDNCNRCISNKITTLTINSYMIKESKKDLKVEKAKSKFNYDKIKIYNQTSKKEEDNQKKTPSKIIRTLKDYDSLSLEEQLKLDSRKSKDYFIEHLKYNHQILSLIYKKSLIDPLFLRYTLLLFAYSNEFTLNSLFFTDSYIDIRTTIVIQFKSSSLNFIYTLTNELSKSIWSVVISIIIEIFINRIVYISGKKEKEFNDSLITHKLDEVKKGNKIFLKNMQRQIYILYAFITMMLLFCWYYSTCFCAVYPFSSIGWLYGCLLSLILDIIIYELIVFFLKTIIREIIRRKVNKYTLMLYKLSEFLLKFI